jgi:hypothetical protein
MIHEEENSTDFNERHGDGGVEAVTVRSKWARSVKVGTARWFTAAAGTVVALKRRAREHLWASSGRERRARGLRKRRSG